jgi:predicted RNase H-like nuclease (RuvC/YqgF family)
LENEFILRQFEEIEKKVEKLIDVNKSLEVTNLEHSNKIKRLEEELQGKVDAENKYTQEKNLIRSKIDSLLVRLEDIAEVE